MVTPAVKREAVVHLKAHLGLSERRACEIAGADRKMVRYQSQRAPDTALRDRLRDLANERRRFGYRRLFVLLRREVEPSGINRIYRLYREEGLTVRRRKARRKAIADARAKAELYADAAGASVGKAVQISEVSVTPVMPVRYRMAEMASDASVPIAAGQNTLTATVTVTFEMR
jgi:transposase InsO family protein